MEELTEFFFRNWILIVVLGNFLGALQIFFQSYCQRFGK